MRLFDVPMGELELLVDGKWESVSCTDRPTQSEVKYLVTEWSKRHTVTAARYNSHTIKGETPVIVWKQ